MGYLLWRNIGQFVRRRPLVFWLFSFGFLVSILALLFTTQVFAAYLAYNERYSPPLRTVQVAAAGDAAQAADRYAGLDREACGLESMTVYAAELPLKASPAPNGYSRLFVGIGSYFDSDAYAQGAKEIILCADALDRDTSYKIGDVFPLAGESYRVIGIFTAADAHEIPLGSWPADVPLSTAMYTCRRPLTSPEGQRLVRTLQDTYGKDAVQLPATQTIWNAQAILEYGVTVLIALMALLNVLYLYLYILRQRKQEFAVLRICGCSAGRGSALLLGEIVLLSSAFFLAGSLLYRFLLSRWIDFGGEYRYSLSLTDYGIVYLLFIVMTVLLFTPPIIRYCRSSPLMLQRQSSL